MQESNFYLGELKNFPQQMTDSIETPCFVVNEGLLRNNLEVLSTVKKRTGAKVLLALKAFAMHSTFPLISRYLDGVCASGPIEAQLGYEKFRKEVHTYSPAYSSEDIKKAVKYSDTIIFNSISQWEKYRTTIKKSKKRIEVGLRVNPGWSEVETDLYNPVIPGSRLGVLPKDLEGQDLTGIDGLHFHALCEQNSDVLTRVLKSFEKSYGKYIKQMKWINFGGGHHITRKDYDVELLIKTINDFKKKYKVQVHIEPGEAVALNAGVLVSTVLDVVHNGVDIAILDTSAEAHMPDVLAQPYRPNIIGAGKLGEQKYAYRLGGMTCLAGDIIGDYSFAKRLKPGDRLVFLDMAHYSMVKTTTFNGVRHPSIALHNPDTGKTMIIKRFGYRTYADRLS
ncbi:MAG: carboxynorspermidine decarboxylase [Candidatus Micrarchaeota archaeon]|nr:carboxynorspermidine decarboxylase [Candidatus Micrarchaeota archaeon]MDE1859693.1 carboxynorspermidine decarboxylase [Candidatus Micrarchaeota archaeon]